MGHWEDIGFQINSLSHLIRHSVNQKAEAGGENPVWGMQGWIIGYLYENRGKDIFQRDIQARFSVQRSTVTGIIQQMEKNGLVLRSSVDWDQRLKRLELTPKAMEMHEQVRSSIRETEDRMSAILTPEEKKTFLALCEKIRSGIESQKSNERKE